MNIHEYQAKELFQRYGIPFHKGIVARTPEAAYEAANELFDPIRQFAVKAQVHAGGRGEAGARSVGVGTRRGTARGERLLWVVRETVQLPGPA